MSYSSVWHWVSHGLSITYYFVLPTIHVAEDLTRRSVRDDLSDEECRSLLNEVG